MIGRLSGILVSKQAPEIIIDINGMGYEVQVPMTTFYNLPETGAHVTIQTHFAVREDAQQLFGFLDIKDKQLFRELIKVNGVGPKLALAILSGMTADEFVACVHQGNVTLLTKLPGVGKKTAERLLIDLKDRLKAWQSKGIQLETGQAGDKLASIAPVTDHSSEAAEALVSLGYKPTEASKLVSKVYQEGMDVQSIIREALKSKVK